MRWSVGYERGSGLGTAYAHRGVLWTRKKQFDRALADLNEAIRLAPADGFGYSARGYLKLEQGELDSAIEDLDHAVRLEPSDPRNYLVRGQVRVARKQYEQAIADYTEALRLIPAIRRHTDYAQAWAGKQEYEKAIADCDEAIRLDPELAEAHWVRANVLVVLGKLDEAIASGTEAIRLDPKRPDFRLVRRRPIAKPTSLTKRSRIATTPSALIRATLTRSRRGPKFGLPLMSSIRSSRIAPRQSASIPGEYRRISGAVVLTRASANTIRLSRISAR